MGVQDSLLQSYRNIFLTTQAVLFSVAVFIAQGRRPALALLLVLLGLPLVVLWHRITVSRGFDVWFFHLRLLRLEAGGPIEEKLFSSFKEWQAKKPEDRLKALKSDPFGPGLLDSKTRKRMDTDLPIAFIVCWVFLGAIAVWLQFGQSISS